MPRSVRALFDLKSKEEDAQILVTFMDVYNEEVYDLLASVPTKLQVKGTYCRQTIISYKFHLHYIIKIYCVGLVTIIMVPILLYTEL